jgi:hypothetical protein
MPTQWRIFVASPSDVKPERNALEKDVREVNLTHGDQLDYRLELVRWETHVAPNAGRPQQVINQQIGSYSIFVGIMWRRFGTPTGLAGSGTEEEFRIAYQAGSAILKTRFLCFISVSVLSCLVRLMTSNKYARSSSFAGNSRGKH